MENVKREIRKFVVENYCVNSDAALGNDDSFMAQGVVDSTGILELVSFVEERFSIKIDSDELVPDNFDSISKVTDFVVRRLGVANAS